MERIEAADTAMTADKAGRRERQRRGEQPRDDSIKVLLYQSYYYTEAGR